MDDILDRAAAVFDLTRADLTGPSRDRHIVWARQAVMCALLERTTLSQVAVGQLLGGRDHSTVAYGAREAAKRAETLRDYARQLDAVRALLSAPKPSVQELARVTRGARIWACWALQQCPPGTTARAA